MSDQCPANSADLNGSLEKNKPQLWINPCGIYSESSDENDFADSDFSSPVNDKDILNTIIIVTKNALDSVEGFKNDFVKGTFDEDFASYYKIWKDVQYDWLFTRDQVPKYLGSEIEPEHLGKLEINNFLRDSYRYLQIIAVALEQVISDQDEDSSFVSKFKEMELRLRAVLCELQMAMIERQVTFHPDVERKIMPDDIRKIEEETHRKLRDWIIFRDFLVILEYIRDVCMYFYENPLRIP